jgi:putative membrane protein
MRDDPPEPVDRTADEPAHRRFPAWGYRPGEEPDPRFSLANERTFLAWIRTSLALLAGGVALEALELPLDPRLRLAASVVLLALALLVPLAGWWHWGDTERAMRTGRPLPSAPLTAVVALGLAAVTALLLAALVVGR